MRSGTVMKQVIVFHSGDQSFALNIEHIDKIIEFETPNIVPETKKYVKGVLKYHGKILPIIDLYERLYGESQEKKDTAKIIVVKFKETHIGLVIDNIVGIKNYEDDQFEDPVQFEDKFSKEYVEGFIKEDEDIIILMNPRKLFSFSEAHALAQLEDGIA